MTASRRNPSPTLAPRRRSDPDRPARAESADLHVHTTHSDGSCSPGEVVRAAAMVGLSALAITDHDTLTALAVARLEAERLGVELVPGIELTAEHDGREIHILGYYFDASDPDLLAATDALRRSRAERIMAMADRLTTLGLSVDLEAIRAIFPRATLGRKHLADWLTRTEQVTSHRDAFTRFLSDNGPATVPKTRLLAQHALDLIRGAGGIAGLAHPPYDLREVTLRALADAGLGAIEVDGPGVTARLKARRRRWADQLGLVPIAGSDFHAPDRPGRWVGSIVTPEPDLIQLRQARPRP